MYSIFFLGIGVSWFGYYKQGYLENFSTYLSVNIYLYMYVYAYLLDIHLEVELESQVFSHMFNFTDTAQQFLTWLCQLSFSSAVY